MDITSPDFVLQQLIRCRSVTPASDGCFDVLQNMAESLGFSVARPKFSAAKTPTIENFYAKYTAAIPHKTAKHSADKRKSEAHKHLMFAGHIDVVPPGKDSAWRHPPFAGHIENGLIFGRGAVDMKGGIACFIAAVARLQAARKPLSGTLSLLLAGDEEGPAVNGTVKLLHWAKAKGEKWDAALLGEPSSAEILGDSIKIGRRGSLSAVLRVIGKQGHVAYPHHAANPLPALLLLMQSLIAAPLDTGTAHFQASNLELTGLNTDNQACNIIPAEAEARFNIRFNDIWSITRLQGELQNRLQAAWQTLPESKRRGISYQLEWLDTPSEAFITHENALVKNLSKAINTVTGENPQLSTSGGTSDARFIKDYCPVAEFGLVGKTMHQTNECAAIEDLENLTQIYQLFIQNFFAA